MTRHRRAHRDLFLSLALSSAFSVCGSPETFGSPARSVGELTEQIARLGGATPNVPLRIDPSLSKAAERALRSALRGESSEGRDAIDDALQREGLADAATLPFAALGNELADLEPALRDVAERIARPRAMTHLGVSLLRVGGRQGLAALFSRRLVELAPLPRSANLPSFMVRGHATRGEKIVAWLRSPCGVTAGQERASRNCADDVDRLAPEVQPGGHLLLDVPFQRGPGRYTFEIVSERGRGPEVTALWTFYVEVPVPVEAAGATQPARSVQPARPARPALNGEEDPLDALLSESRRVAGLRPLVRHEALDRAAQEQADWVCESMLAVHVRPNKSSPIERALRAGYRGAVTENIAIAESIGRAHENLLASPSHRRAILDQKAGKVGIGVAVSRERSVAFCVVELFAGHEGR